MLQETNRRGRRTRAALRDALAAEIEATGDLGQVTVTAVTDRADVTRRTFYSHYRDIPDLVQSIEDESIAEMRPLVATISQTTLDELKDAVDHFKPCPGTIEMLTYFRDRGSYLAALYGEGGDPGFRERLELLVREVARERVAQGMIVPYADAIVDYYLTYAISAEVGVLVRWLTTGMRESVGIMARLMTALMFIRPGDLYGRPIGFEIPIASSELVTQRREPANG